LPTRQFAQTSHALCGVLALAGVNSAREQGKIINKILLFKSAISIQEVGLAGKTPCSNLTGFDMTRVDHASAQIVRTGGESL